MASVVVLLFSCVSWILVSGVISTKEQEDVLHAIKSAYDEMKKEVSTLKEELTLIKQKDCECATKIDSYNSKSPRFLVLNGQAPVAFHTHLSANFNVSSNHAVAYDMVKINVGDGYNKFSGIFKAPKWRL